MVSTVDFNGYSINIITEDSTMNMGVGLSFPNGWNGIVINDYCWFQWISSRENLQKKPTFDGKSMVNGDCC